MPTDLVEQKPSEVMLTASGVVDQIVAKVQPTPTKVVNQRSTQVTRTEAVFPNAIKSGGDDSGIKNHLPTAQDLEYCTGDVRDALKLQDGSTSQHSRVLCLVVVTFLIPLLTLTTDPVSFVPSLNVSAVSVPNMAHLHSFSLIQSC